MTDAIDSIEALLPWYAAGALSEQERADVEAALAARPELRASLATIQEDRDETIALNEALGAPRPDVWARILKEVETAPRPLPWGRRLSAWLGFGEAPRLAWAMAAAAAIILLQAAAIAVLLPSASKSSFTTASYAPPPGADVLVAFAPDAKVDDLTKFLREHQATIVSGPRGGMYELRVGDRALEKPEFDALLKAISASAVVKMALPGAK
jgi:hypothetical protein